MLSAMLSALLSAMLLGELPGMLLEAVDSLAVLAAVLGGLSATLRGRPSRLMAQSHWALALRDAFGAQGLRGGPQGRPQGQSEPKMSLCTSFFEISSSNYSSVVLSLGICATLGRISHVARKHFAACIILISTYTSACTVTVYKLYTFPAIHKLLYLQVVLVKQSIPALSSPRAGNQEAYDVVESPHSQTDPKISKAESHLESRRN